MNHCCCCCNKDLPHQLRHHCCHSRGSGHINNNKYTNITGTKSDFCRKVFGKTFQSQRAELWLTLRCLVWTHSHYVSRKRDVYMLSMVNETQKNINVFKSQEVNNLRCPDSRSWFLTRSQQRAINNYHWSQVSSLLTEQYNILVMLSFNSSKFQWSSRWSIWLRSI